jgi:flagellar biosynthesis chaperone FliJ
MARFVFKLQPVLDQRLREERERKIEVARLEKERVDYEGRLRRQQGFISESKGALRDAMGGAGHRAASVSEGGHRVNPSLLRLQATNALHLNYRAHQTVLGLAGLHKRLEEARGRLAEASKARRAIELLRERRYEEWRRERERRERIDTDELVTARAARTTGDTTAPRTGRADP